MSAISPSRVGESKSAFTRDCVLAMVACRAASCWVASCEARLLLPPLPRLYRGPMALAWHLVVR